MMTDDDTELDTTVKKILGNMTSMMSDRVSVMKAIRILPPQGSRSSELTLG